MLIAPIPLDTQSLVTFLVTVDHSRAAAPHPGSHQDVEPKRVPLLVRLTELRKDPNATNHQLNDADRPVTVKEAARFLGVSPSLVYEYVSRKQIPRYRMMGRCIRFRLSELAAWREGFHVYPQQ